MTDPILERDPKLRLVVERLVGVYRPERIYLFGSIARGDADEDNDYDLMVLVPDDATPERRGSRLAYQALRGTGIAADVLVWTRGSSWLDLAAAKHEFTAEPPFVEDIVFHAQQAVEKSF